jgi:iron(III) transport system ATP-binding protein
VLGVDGLVKAYPDGQSRDRTVAVDGISFEVETGELYSLLGPSGCGKTTTLRCVAGLERPDAGRVVVGDRVVFCAATGVDIPANRRGLGLVFQSYGLWPHLTAFETVAFPLRSGPRKARAPRAEVRHRVERALAMVRLQGLEGRRPAELSGGQQQRLALARALVMEPPLLLLDEPLSNLDARLREDMRLELKRLLREVRVTALYVTHDQTEALALSKRIVVMRDGRIEQVGKPREIYERPRSRFVAEFLGNPNLIEGVIIRATGDGVVVRSRHGSLRVRAVAAVGEGDAVLVSVPPDRVRLEQGTPPDGAPNRWPGTIRNRAFRGDSVEHVVAVAGVELRARCHSSVSIPPGTDVSVVLPEDDCSLVPSDHRPSPVRA